MAAQQPRNAAAGTLWFSPPEDGQDTRRTLTRERVVTEALAIISTDGAQSLSMRGLATRLGVVPGALYRHVRNKEQLYDLILDAVLTEVDCRADPAQPWAGQVTTLAQCLRATVENHPGTAALLKTRDPLSPASLALAEAFLASLLAAPMPAPDAALAFRLIYDYTLGFAVADTVSPVERRLRDAATRQELHAFLRSLPPARFPVLAAYGTHAWEDDRDQRFAFGLRAIIRGFQAAQPSLDSDLSS
jgi:AcrR family transcriptional regulator